MARSSMGQLIAKVRTLINDVSITPIFSSDDIQDALDVYRTERRWVPLRPQPTFTPGGPISYLDYYADAEYWEADAVLQDLSFVTIQGNADLVEFLVGHWHFPTQPNGIGVRATGKTYDVYAGAADLLEAWAARVMLDFDFTNGQDQFRRQQKYQMLTNLAGRYRRRALPRGGRLVQSDAATLHDGPSVTYPTLGQDSS